MKRIFYLFFLFSFGEIVAQSDTTIHYLAFYNVENLFDPANDSLTQDDAFTPDGLNRWSYKRYYKKSNNTAKVILAMGKGNPPTIIGLAEIENDRVLQHLCRYSPLKNYNYQFVHYDSPDSRGIDVALLYRPDKITILHSEPIPIVFPFEPQSRNRDMLYVKTQLPNQDTLHIFINHWTSRYGGLAQTIAKRNHYALTLRQKVDSIFKQDLHANIFIAGDFNDYPTDKSMSQILNALSPNEKKKKENGLYNLMLAFSSLQNIGSHKYEDFWGCLDQIVVSMSLLSSKNSLQVVEGKAEIFKEDFMVEPDLKYGGDKLFRTYLGPRYIGGFADHLPVYIRLLEIRKEAR